MAVRCYLWCKDTNFNANHNWNGFNTFGNGAVIYGAKILILMQITTTHSRQSRKLCCYLWCKDTNFNANHNHVERRSNRRKAVIYGAKILILMQITTA